MGTGPDDVMARDRVYIEGVREMVAELRAANDRANEAIKQVGWRVADDFAREAATRAAGLGRIEGRDLADHDVFTVGTSRSVHIEARFGGSQRFSGGATTSLLVRPYEFGTATGSILVDRRTKKGRSVYRRSFPKNADPDGRVVLPLAKKYAARLVAEIVREVYEKYRIALGDTNWVQVTSRG